MIQKVHYYINIVDIINTLIASKVNEFQDLFHLL